MKCKKCGNEFDGNVCPHCGTPVEQPRSKDQSLPPHKDNGTLCMVLGILGLAFSLFCFGWIFAIAAIVVGRKCKDTQTPGRRKVGMVTSIITLALTVLILIAAAVSGDDNATETEQTEIATEIESIETEVAPTEAEPAPETETVPEANTSAMVDYIAAEAKKSANQAATEEKRDEAIEYISSHYPNYFADNETMEKTMYYGYYLEYAYMSDDPTNVYANLGMDTYQAVKYVYRGTESVEDDHVTENLRQISEWLNKLGYNAEFEDGSGDASGDASDARDVPSEYVSALNKANSYSDNMHMSKQGIYEQLTSEYGEKFSEEAAQYAIDNMEADWNYNALQTAQSYSDNMHMSKQGIYDQLISAYGEQFTEDEAQYAVDNVDADWNYNALQTAKSYQENMDMSPEAIRDQLTSEYGEQFTPEEAAYAIENLE